MRACRRGRGRGRSLRRPAEEADRALRSLAGGGADCPVARAAELPPARGAAGLPARLLHADAVLLPGRCRPAGDRALHGGPEREAWPDLAGPQARVRRLSCREAAQRRLQRGQPAARAASSTMCASSARAAARPVHPDRADRRRQDAGLARLRPGPRRARTGCGRVIYVIPFTSIIEQTADVFRAAARRRGRAGASQRLRSGRLRHGRRRTRSGRSGEERHRQAAENWDAPVVVTTAVQLFESLFAARPGRCRKLHNLARARDRARRGADPAAAPAAPCVAALDELARNYGASVVLMTATQPALHGARPQGRARGRARAGAAGSRPASPRSSA